MGIGRRRPLSRKCQGRQGRPATPQRRPRRRARHWTYVRKSSICGQSRTGPSRRFLTSCQRCRPCGLAWHSLNLRSAQHWQCRPGRQRRPRRQRQQPPRQPMTLFAGPVSKMTRPAIHQNHARLVTPARVAGGPACDASGKSSLRKTASVALAPQRFPQPGRRV